MNILKRIFWELVAVPLVIIVTICGFVYGIFNDYFRKVVIKNTKDTLAVKGIFSIFDKIEKLIGVRK